MLRYLLLCCALLAAAAGGAQPLVGTRPTAGAFPLLGPGNRPTIVYDRGEDSLVHIAARLLAADLVRLGASTPVVSTELPARGRIILVGSKHSAFLRRLTESGKLQAPGLQNAWEAFHLQVVRAPFPGISEALVIAGSDRRGTAYGALELSRQAGVSPWHWWADVPVAPKKELFVRAGALTDAPAVKYRGLFINDEAPALSSWSREKFGGFNHDFYQKVFELMLRLKANYLWPAMWGSAFYADDPQNRQTADDWGIVIGTSHHEPLMRAHDEWRREGGGRWSYDSNAARLRAFWKAGIARATNEKIVTIGMRGDGDEPMTEETATALLERIVNDQRGIIAGATGRPASETPQLWALYKEVQDYYDKGMRVPDDVTLLLCDDNWGNLRRLPPTGKAPRKGGYGIYYHFDYVGGPRNYKWLNTNNLARVWEQMNLAWHHGARRIWIVNVGDIKPMELPLTFFMDQAWNPARFTAENIDHYYEAWAGAQFGAPHAKAIGSVLRKYAQYSARRKPELLSSDTYNLRYHEWNNVLHEWEALQAEAEAAGKKLMPAQQDAYFQLVLHPVQAFANLHRLYNAVAWNQHFAPERLAVANEWADKAENYYAEDSLLTLRYHALGGGKWNGMMAQTHIGYTYWQQPERNAMPALTRVPAASIVAPGPLTDTTVQHSRDEVPRSRAGKAFYEWDGSVSMQAAHWTKAAGADGINWKIIPGVGRDGDGISSFPVTRVPTSPDKAPYVEYEFYTYDSGRVQLNALFSPTLSLFNSGGLRYAVSIDDEAPQVFALNADDNKVHIWEGWVASNTIDRISTHTLRKPGRHVLRYRALSPAIVLQKLVLRFGTPKPFYLGPPETLSQK
ncbi:MAG: glycosyhydrolase [Chitinophagaceae bacterium]|nr:MAG: glycosyhydrolase [Chitinophagaceae bacterium]